MEQVNGPSGEFAPVPAVSQQVAQHLLPFGLQGFHQNQGGVPPLPPHIQHPPISISQIAAEAAAHGGSGKKRGRKPNDSDNAVAKRPRSKKPADAPKRPKSAYMFFLAEFREKWKQENPNSKKVADVARAAGEIWRQMSEEKKNDYEVRSTGAKAAYASAMVEYEQDHPKPARRQTKQRDPSELKRPQSAYFFFLHDFREGYKVEHPNEQLQVSVLGKLAGEKWKTMTPEEKSPYEQLSTISKAEYAKQKMLTPDERRMYAAATMSAMMQSVNGSAPMPALGAPGFDMQSLAQLQSMANGSIMQQSPSPGIPLMQQAVTGMPAQMSHQAVTSMGNAAPVMGNVMMSQAEMNAAASVQQYNATQLQFFQQIAQYQQQQQVMAGMISGQQAMQQLQQQQQQGNQLLAQHAAAGMMMPQQAMAAMQQAAGSMLAGQPGASAGQPTMQQLVGGFPAQQQAAQMAAQQHSQGAAAHHQMQLTMQQQQLKMPMVHLPSQPQQLLPRAMGTPQLPMPSPLQPMPAPVLGTPSNTSEAQPTSVELLLPSPPPAEDPLPQLPAPTPQPGSPLPLAATIGSPGLLAPAVPASPQLLEPALGFPQLQQPSMEGHQVHTLLPEHASQPVGVALQPPPASPIHQQAADQLPAGSVGTTAAVSHEGLHASTAMELSVDA